MRNRGADKEKVQIRAEQLGRALIALEPAVGEPMQKSRLNIDGTIQRFEYTFELFWKLLKALLETHGVKTNYPKEILIQAYSGYMINDEGMWIAMLDDRNNAAHTYDEKFAYEIYLRIKNYAKFLRSELDVLHKKYEL